MDMLIKEGKIIRPNNIVNFNDSTDEITIKFKDSLNRVLDYLDGYYLDKYNGNTLLNIYYLYSFKTNPKEIKNVIENLLDNNDSNIINNSSILMSLYGLNDSSIFWDVLNSIIIVLDKDNLKVLLYELEKLRWARRNIKFNSKDFEEKYINVSASNVYKKALKL